MVDVCVPVTVKPFAYTGPVKTICCNSPGINTGSCTGEPNGSCFFTVSQTICVEVPVIVGADVTPGPTYVQCGDKADGECSCDNGNTTD
ncbi:MAG: hypothetical protein ACOX6I_07190 [Syntrophomonadaceae bacterium]